MGLVNTVVPLDKVEDETVAWCKDIMKHSPTALRFKSCNECRYRWFSWFTTNGWRCYITVLYY